MGRAGTLLVRVAAVGAMALLAGCNILGPAGFFLMGPERTPAQYELDPEKAVVVFVDDSGSLVPERTSRRRIGQTAERALLDEAEIKRVISSDAALAVASREKFGQPLGVSEIGQAVGADLVVYALVTSFQLSPDGASFQPSASALVRVVDVKTKERIWPVGDQTAQQVAVVSTERQGPPPTNVGQRTQAERVLAGRLGDEIAKLFYEHQMDQAKSRVGGSSGDEPR